MNLQNWIFPIFSPLLGELRGCHNEYHLLTVHSYGLLTSSSRVCPMFYQQCNKFYIRTHSSVDLTATMYGNITFSLLQFGNCCSCLLQTSLTQGTTTTESSTLHWFLSGNTYSHTYNKGENTDTVIESLFTKS